MPLKLYVLPGSPKHDLPSLDPESIVAASYLQLLRPGQWQFVHCTDPGQSPSGSLPFLQLESGQCVAGSAILHNLQRATSKKLDASAQSESVAFQALLDTTVLPLTLHSLYSLPQNWSFIRQLIASEMPYPIRLWRPAQLRESARELVEATHPDWWNLGGEAEKEEEAARRRKKALLETGVEGLKERKEEERKDGKERMRNAFGEGKITAAAREVFAALETTLASSSTPFFFSSSEPTPLDAHLSSLLSLVLYLPLPQPLLADLINASFPRLWTHTALLRRTLWSDPPPPAKPLESATLLSWTRSIAQELTPRPWEWDSLTFLGLGPGNDVSRAGRGSGGSDKVKAKEFARKRWQFFGVVAVGVLGWGLGTGTIPLPGKLGRLLQSRGRWGDGDEDDDEEGGEWIEVDEEEDDDDEVIELDL